MNLAVSCDARTHRKYTKGSVLMDLGGVTVTLTPIRLVGSVGFVGFGGFGGFVGFGGFRVKFLVEYSEESPMETVEFCEKS